MVRKTNFLKISRSFLLYLLLCLKREVTYEIPQKCFTTTERHSLAGFGSLWGKKQFLLIFVPFYWFIKKCCLNKSKFSSGFAPLKHGKKNKHSEYFCARFCDSHFYVQKEVLYEFPQKCFKTTKMYSLAVCGSLLEKNSFCYYLSHFTGWIKNVV